MIKSTRNFFVICIAIVCLASLLAILVGRSFSGISEINSLKELPEEECYTYFDMYAYGDTYFCEDIHRFNDLYEKADLVVKGKVSGNRELFLQATKTKTELLHVYKGTGVEKGECIYIYEPTTILYGLSYYECMGGYMLMLDEEEYIMFLQHLKVPDSYKYKKDEEHTYVPISTTFSKYSLSQEDHVAVVDDFGEEQVLFRDTMKYEIIAATEEKKEKYIQLKQEVLKRLNHEVTGE